jgi:hypothetical protein
VSRSKHVDGAVETVRITAWFYAFLCMVLAPIALLSMPDTETAGLEPILTLAVYALLSAGILSVLRGKRLGYYCCYVVSALILLQPPFGTILGWNMLRALRQSRARL